MLTELINVTTKANEFTLKKKIKSLYENVRPKNKTMDKFSFDNLINQPKNPNDRIYSEELMNEWKEKLESLEETAASKHEKFIKDEAIKEENSKTIYDTLRESLKNENITKAARIRPSTPDVGLKQAEAAEINDNSDDIDDDDNSDDIDDDDNSDEFSDDSDEFSDDE